MDRIFLSKFPSLSFDFRVVFFLALLGMDMIYGIWDMICVIWEYMGYDMITTFEAFFFGI